MLMLIAPDRESVIRNIRDAASRGDFNAKVETGDPQLTAAERRALLDRFVRSQHSPGFLIKKFVARRMADVMTFRLVRYLTIEGMENLADVKGGAVVTSNHFNPFDNGIIRAFVTRAHRGNLYTLSQDTNFAMKGYLGFLLNYADLIPVSADKGYMKETFGRLVSHPLRRGRFLLVYSEEEMWFNYRKPRPPKRGAYLYSALNGVPVVSCFTEMHDTDEIEAPGFMRQRYTLHVLPPIWPDPNLSPRDNSFRMMEQDYRQKCAAYERAYGLPLDYTFHPSDIAGWTATEWE